MRFRLLCLFLASLYISGASYYLVPLGSLNLNFSPANLILVAALAHFWRTGYLQALQVTPERRRALVTSLRDVFWEPRWLRLPLMLAVVMVFSILIGVFKGGDPLPNQRFLTGLAGISAFVVVAKSITTWRELVIFLRLFLVLALVGAFLTFLAALQWFPAADVPFFHAGFREEGRVIGSYQFPFRTDATFGLVSEIWGAHAIIALALSAMVLRHLNERKYVRPAVAAVGAVALLCIAVLVVQSRSTWLAVFCMGPLLALYQVRGLVPSRWRPVALIVVALLPWGILGYALYAVGGPLIPPDVLQYYRDGNRPDVLGFRLPREFFSNAMIRISFFHAAWEWLAANPFTGAPGSELEEFNGHSAYVELAATAGLLPLLSLAGLLFAVVRKPAGALAGAAVAMRYSLLVALYGLLVLSLFFFGIFHKEFFIVAALLMLASGRLVVPALPAPDLAGERHNRPAGTAIEQETA